MKKISKILLLLLILTITLTGCATPAINELAQLPTSQKTAGDYSFENSGINHENLLDYLNREDSVYIDLRNYEDYSKKHFKNFEVIPFFAYIYNENAGSAELPQLYKGTPDAPEAVYDSSDTILNALFPKDKNLIILCQSGGRVAMLMKILAAKGYDMTKVYNIGGMAQYTGSEYRSLITDVEELNVEVKYIINAQ